MQSKPQELISKLEDRQVTPVFYVRSESAEPRADLSACETAMRAAFAHVIVNIVGLGTAQHI